MKSLRLLAFLGACLALLPVSAFGQDGTTTGTAAPAPTTPTQTTTTQSSSQPAESAKLPSFTSPKLTMQATNTGQGAANKIPSNSNIIVGWYGNPMSFGDPTKWSKGPPSAPTGSFATPLYVQTTSTTNTATTQQTTKATGFSTYGTVRAPVYMTKLSDDVPVVTHQASDLSNTIRAAIENSSFLESKNNIEIIVNGGIVELRGRVATERERRIVGGLAGTTPGFRNVVNQLIVQAK